MTLSKDTTLITEPLTGDGYPDYVEALNRKYAQGVTPDNNALALLWQITGPVSGPGRLPDKQRAKYFRRLGIAEPPADGDYLVTYAKFVDDLRWRKLTDKEIDVFAEEYQQATIRPWTEAKYPRVAKWLAANQQALSRAEDMIRRPRFYAPLVSEYDRQRLISADQSYAGPAREIGRLFAARAMLRLGQDNAAEAIEDIGAIHRWAKLVGQGPTLVDALVGSAIAGINNDLIISVVEHGRPGRRELDRLRRQFRDGPVTATFADRFDEAERYTHLEVVCDIARNGPGELIWLGSLEPALTDAEQERVKFINRLPIDPNLILKQTNQWMDRLTAAARTARPAERKAAMDAFRAEFKILNASAEEFNQIPLKRMLAEFPDKAKASEKVGQMFLAIVLPATMGCLTAEQKADTSAMLNDMVLALAAYRTDKGHYPAALKELVPTYAPAISGDCFTGAALRYERNADGFRLYSVGANGEDEGGRGLIDAPAGDDLLRQIPQPPAKRYYKP